MKKKKNKITIAVYQHDWIPGFAAYKTGTLSKKAKAHVILNIGSLLRVVAEKKIPKEELPYTIAECLMHEVIHVLQEWAGAEFSEDKVDELIAKYQKKYSKN